jgi:hypothetical protein
MAPWIYVAFNYWNQLAVTQNISAVFNVIGFFPHSLDNVWSRLSPVPLDLRSLAAGVKDVDTPYLDAQISLPLLAVLGLTFAFYVSNRKNNKSRLADTIGWLALAMTAITFVVSVHPSLSGRFGGLFDMLQIPFRLVNYVNIGLLVSVIAFAVIRGEARPSKGSVGKTVLTACLAVAAVALIGKLLHAGAVMEPIGAAGLPPVPNWVWVAYNTGPAYQTANETSQNTVNAAIPVATEGVDFGIPGKLTVHLERPSLVVTNVQQFLWNRLVVDGEMLPLEKTLVVQKSSDAVLQGLAVELPAGAHELGYAFEPPTIWHVLMPLSWAVLIAWAVAYIVLLVRAVIRPLSESAP